MIKARTRWGFLDETGLGADLAALLPGDPTLVNQVFDELGWTDRDDVAQALVEAVPNNVELRAKSLGCRWLFLRLVRELQSGWTTDAEARAIERLVRAASPEHDRLTTEPWMSDPAVRVALADTGATPQSSASGWGSGDMIFDEYSVVIERMPSGTTPEAYLNEMALDINKAVKSSGFNFVNVFRKMTGSPEAAMVGDIYSIDMLGPDNGSVMLVESESDHFVFQTAVTIRDGTHPEYGAREFGFERLDSGAVRWFTRGASRPSWAPGTATLGRHLQTLDWTSAISGIAAELTRRGGTARAGSETHWTTHRNDLTWSGFLHP